MYGTTEMSASGAVLASTGLAMGSYVLAGIGLIFAGIAVIMLVKKNSKNRP